MLERCHRCIKTSLGSRFLRGYHVYLSWGQKCNVMMSVYFETTFPIKRGGFVYFGEI